MAFLSFFFGSLDSDSKLPLGEVVSRWDLEPWQQPPVDSIVDKYPRELQAVLDSKIMELFGESFIVGRFEPWDFQLAGYSFHRRQIMADVFNNNVDIMSEILEEADELFGAFGFADDDFGFGNFGNHDYSEYRSRSGNLLDF